MEFLGYRSAVEETRKNGAYVLGPVEPGLAAGGVFSRLQNRCVICTLLRVGSTCRYRDDVVDRGRQRAAPYPLFVHLDVLARWNELGHENLKVELPKLGRHLNQANGIQAHAARPAVTLADLRAGEGLDGPVRTHPRPAPLVLLAGGHARTLPPGTVRNCGK